MAETRLGSDKQTRSGSEPGDMVMAWLIRDLVFLILQFLEKEKFKETVHKLEQESGLYFNMKHFEEAVLNGEWDEVDEYLSGFTHVDDNRFSTKMFFEIRKQKFLEALDKPDRSKALDILVKDLKVLLASNEDLFKEMMQLLTLENFRENEQLSKYGDVTSARGVVVTELKMLILANPKLRGKLQFPSLESSRLITLIKQSLNWQHNNCKNPRQNSDIKTLFYDHLCSQPNGCGRVPSSAPPFMNVTPKAGGFPQMAPHRLVAAPVPSPNASNTTQMAGGFLQMAPHGPAAAPLPSPLSGCMANASNATQMAGAIMQMAPHRPVAAPVPSPNASNATQMSGGFPQMAPHGPAATPLPSPLAGCMANASNAHSNGRSISANGTTWGFSASGSSSSLSTCRLDGKCIQCHSNGRRVFANGTTWDFSAISASGSSSSVSTCRLHDKCIQCHSNGRRVSANGSTWGFSAISASSNYSSFSTCRLHGKCIQCHHSNGRRVSANGITWDPKGDRIPYAAKCKKCANIYKWRKGGGTGTISRHYETCYGKNTISASQTQISFGTTGSTMDT